MSDIWTTELYDDKFMLFPDAKFVAICYSSSKNLIQTR